MQTPPTLHGRHLVLLLPSGAYPCAQGIAVTSPMMTLAMRWLALEVTALCGPEKPPGKEPTELRCTWPMDHMPHEWHADFPGVYGDWLCSGIGPPSPLAFKPRSQRGNREGR